MWHLKQTLAILIGCFSLFSARTAHAALLSFTDRATFLSFLQPGFFFEDDFSDLSLGEVDALFYDRPTGGFTTVAYEASFVGVFSVEGAISVFDPEDDLGIFFDDGNVYAVGGYFYFTDEEGNFQPFDGSDVTAVAVNAFDSPEFLTAPNSLNNFFGWISSTPIYGVAVQAGGLEPNRWVTVDNLIVATAPEPGTLGLLSLGALVLVRRRRK